MGYRSDVGLALKQPAVHTLHQKLNALDKNSEAFSVVSDFLVYADKHLEDADSGAEVYLWEGIKWYEEFSDVGFIENLLTELDWSNFLFIRIGEDYDDTEARGDFWENPFDLKLTRKNLHGSPEPDFYSRKELTTSPYPSYPFTERRPYVINIGRTCSNRNRKSAYCP